MTLPQLTWNVNATTGIIAFNITSQPFPPLYVKIWHAHTISTTRRDFRLLTGWSTFQPVFWFDDYLNGTDGVYTATRPAPGLGDGWEGFFVEVTYMVSQTEFWKFTSEVCVLPNTLPFPNCAQNCQPPPATPAPAPLKLSLAKDKKGDGKTHSFQPVKPDLSRPATGRWGNLSAKYKAKKITYA